MLTFKKSSFSGWNNDECVDVAMSESIVAVRHSKKHDQVIEFTHGEWQAFIRGVKNKEFEIDSLDTLKNG